MFYEDAGTPQLLIGKTLESVETNEHSDEMLFICTDGEAFRAYHMQDCCESVKIHDIRGSLCDLVGSPIMEASEESVSDTTGEWPADMPKPDYLDSWTVTTHRFKNEAGTEVVVRWLGESNGYYGEEVHFQRTHKPVSGFVA
jgi:hypothetical protein